MTALLIFAIIAILISFTYTNAIKIFSFELLMSGMELIALFTIALILLLAGLWRFFTHKMPVNAAITLQAEVKKSSGEHFHLLGGEMVRAVMVSVKPEPAANSEFIECGQ